jgi:hypothetical protein
MKTPRSKAYAFRPKPLRAFARVSFGRAEQAKSSSSNRSLISTLTVDSPLLKSRIVSSSASSNAALHTRLQRVQSRTCARSASRPSHSSWVKSQMPIFVVSTRFWPPYSAPFPSIHFDPTRRVRDSSTRSFFNKQNVSQRVELETTAARPANKGLGRLRFDVSNWRREISLQPVRRVKARPHHGAENVRVPDQEID